MTILKCVSSKNLTSTTHQFPLIGTVTFDKDCSIRVDDDKVDEFLKIQCGYEFEVVKSKAKVEKVKGEKKDSLEGDTEKEIYEQGLKELEEVELDALISTHPTKETKKLKTVESKINYLVGKQFA